MTRRYVQLPVGILNRPTMRSLTAEAKLTYLVIRTAETTSRAGVSFYSPAAWAESASLSESMVDSCVMELEFADLAVLDWPARELLLFDAIRDDEARVNPSVLERTIQDAEAVRSRRLQLLIAAELAALRLPRAELAAECIQHGNRVPAREDAGPGLTWAEKQHCRRMRTKFHNSPARRRLRAEIAAGLHVCPCGETDGLQVDHIQSLARGGSNDLSNLQVLCGPCNMRKGWR